MKLLFILKFATFLHPRQHEKLSSTFDGTTEYFNGKLKYDPEEFDC